MESHNHLASLVCSRAQAAALPLLTSLPLSQSFRKRSARSGASRLAPLSPLWCDPPNASPNPMGRTHFPQQPPIRDRLTTPPARFPFHPQLRALVFVFFPISFPIAKLLDASLGHERHEVWRRPQLKALVDLQSRKLNPRGLLSEIEIEIIDGALDMSSKTVGSVMTPMDGVFSLPEDSSLGRRAQPRRHNRPRPRTAATKRCRWRPQRVLGCPLALPDTLFPHRCAAARPRRDTLESVLSSGFSRIPVHVPGESRRILGMVLVKEMVLLTAKRRSFVVTGEPQHQEKCVVARCARPTTAPQARSHRRRTRLHSVPRPPAPTLA